MRKLFLIVTPFFFSSILQGQYFEGDKFKLTTENEISTLTFEDTNSDGTYINGQLVKSFGRVSLNKKEFSDLLVNLKKVSKKSEITLTSENYILDKYDWDSTKSVYITIGKKIGEISAAEVKQLLKLK